jgi:hypothetical protein
MIDFLLTAKRDAASAKRFFRKAFQSPGNPSPRVINVDKNPAYAVAIRELKAEGVLSKRSRLRQCRFLQEEFTKQAGSHVTHTEKGSSIERAGLVRTADNSQLAGNLYRLPEICPALDSGSRNRSHDSRSEGYSARVTSWQLQWRGDPEQAFFEAGKFIVDYCDLLFAVRDDFL